MSKATKMIEAVGQDTFGQHNNHREANEQKTIERGNNIATSKDPGKETVESNFPPNYEEATVSLGQPIQNIVQYSGKSMNLLWLNDIPTELLKRGC